MIIAKGLEEVFENLISNYHFVEMQQAQLKLSLQKIALHTEGFNQDDLVIEELNPNIQWIQLGEFPITSCIAEANEIVAEVTAVSNWISNIEMMKHMGFN